MKVDDSIKLMVFGAAHPDGKKLKMQAFKSISDGKYAYDGHHLNGMEVQAVLSCQKDFDELIHLLQIHKNAFTI